MTSVFFDIETNGYLEQTNTIHCLEMAAIINDHRQTISSGGKLVTPMIKALESLAKADEIIGHNIICFDIPAIKKCYSWWKPSGKIIDTLVLSRMLYPEVENEDLLYKYTNNKKYQDMKERKLIGKHSLEAWGYRLGIYKGDFGKTTDWKEWTSEMQQYCKQDVVVTEALYNHFLKKYISWDAYELEREFQEYIFEQQEHGCYFDTGKAIKLKHQLMEELEVTKAEIKLTVPNWIEKTIFEPKKNNKVKGYVVGQKYERTKEVEFNPNSRLQIERFLKEKYEWEPSELTKTGRAKVSADILDELTALDWIEAKLFSKYLTITKLLGYISEGDNAWLKLVRNTGRIHGQLITNGAVTRRCTHFRPNLSQVPSIKKYLGKECRSLFIAPKEYKFVGADMSGIELRCFGHYLSAYDGGDYARNILDGDIHTRNQKAAGLPTRDNAKTFIYACVPLDTLVLTKQGWKKHNELQIGELTLTYNAEKHVKEWQPIEDIVYYDDAEIIEMSHNHSFKIRSTPNHRWFVNQRTRSKTGKSFKRPYYVSKVMTTEELNTESNIIVNAPMLEDKESTFSFEKEKSNIDWCDKVLSMSSKERLSFLQGFLLADGHLYRSKFNFHWQWTQNVGEIAEGLLLCLFLESSGNVYVRQRRGSNKDIWSVNISSKGHTTGQKLKRTKLKNAPVFCIKTKNSSFVIRQGNCITITGNTLYGAGDAKIGLITNPHGTLAIRKSTGRRLKDNFNTAIPAYSKLQSDIQRALKSRGYLIGIDGHRLTPRSAHAGLNTLLQNCAAVLMKRATIIFRQKMLAKGLWLNGVFPVLHVHDELSVIAKPEIAEEVKNEIVKSMNEAGEYYKLIIKVDGEGKIGDNWYDVH